MSRSKTFLNDAVALTLGTLAGRVLGIVLLPLYTYRLTRTEFGTVDLVMTTIDIVLQLVFLAIFEATLRFAMTQAERSNDVLRTALIFVSGGSVLLIPLAACAALWWPPIDVAVVLAILIAQAFTLVFGAWARAIGRVRTYAMSGVLQAVGIGCANVVFLVFLDLGDTGFMLSLLVGWVVGAAALLGRMPWVTALRSASFDRSLLIRMLTYSLPLVPTVLLWWLTNMVGRYFLAFSHGLDEVGIYGVASRFSTIVLVMSTTFTQAWQLAANRSAEADESDQGQFYSTVFRFYAAMMMICISSVLVALKPMMAIAAAPSFYEAWRVVPPLLLGAMFAAFAMFYGAIYTAAKRSKGVLKTSVVGGAMSVLFNALLVPKFGVLGAAIATALCFLALWLLRVADSQWILATSISARLLVPGLLLLMLQVAVQYSSLSVSLSYCFLLVGWLVLVLIFRFEVSEAIRRARGLAKFSLSRQ